MYFSTISSYDNEIVEIIDHEKCLICWETATNSNNLIKMNSLHLFSSFYKSCSCNCIIHSDCLLEWVNKKQSCPICRNEIEIDVSNKNEYKFKFKYKTQLQILYIFIDNNTYKLIKLFKYFCIFILIQNFYYIMKDIQYTIEHKYDKNNL
jgi:hypothetical protein